MLYVDAELSDVPEVYYQETFVDFLQVWYHFLLGLFVYEWYDSKHAK